VFQGLNEATHAIQVRRFVRRDARRSTEDLAAQRPKLGLLRRAPPEEAT
jgi:hypothetical protein